MDYAIGIVLALAVSGWAALVGFDRDRVFYPMLLVVIACYYVLFAAMGGSASVMLAESVAMLVFAALAVVGFRTNLWIVAAALAGHGLFDAVHGYVVTNPGMPVWWPPFCLAYDVAAAAAMVWVLRRRPALTTGPWLART